MSKREHLPFVIYVVNMSRLQLVMMYLLHFNGFIMGKYIIESM